MLAVVSLFSVFMLCYANKLLTTASYFVHMCGVNLLSKAARVYISRHTEDALFGFSDIIVSSLKASFHSILEQNPTDVSTAGYTEKATVCGQSKTETIFNKKFYSWAHTSHSVQCTLTWYGMTSSLAFVFCFLANQIASFSSKSLGYFVVLHVIFFVFYTKREIGHFQLNRFTGF